MQSSLKLNCQVISSVYGNGFRIIRSLKDGTLPDPSEAKKGNKKAKNLAQGE